MDWFRSGISTLTGFFVEVAPASSPTSVERAQGIRAAMLAALAEEGAARYSRLAQRIRYCLQPRMLWDMRGDLMNALSLMYGESRARELMTDVDSRFAGAVPAAWTPLRAAAPHQPHPMGR
ncbi:MAG TPA: hypothetical protein VHA82_14175 [Ramlibacter sp.]|uniref:hypothetical protein n=1 Tax=Ramlibacter sp. TaxID=1917967 RepID=UPI002BF2EED5|nr:hypothetical protein [Ramlibacter sp.]HVZ44954.1 hypothetical protein [Ramlibacter sp.]